MKRPHWLYGFFLFFLQRRLGRRVPLLASFKLTFHCNLACSACPFHHRARESGAHMSWDTARQSLDELQRRGCRIVMFEGGEPMLWRDGERGIRDLVDYARLRFVRVGLTTNGTLPIDVAADVVWVSIDGLKETHDRLRSSSFDRICATLAATAHPKVLIHCTLNRENWRELPDLVRLLQTFPAVRGITVQLFYPYNQGEESLKLSAQERRAALESALLLKRQGFPIMNSSRMLRAMIDNSWRCYDDILINVDPDGTVTAGCYVKSRGAVECSQCGFTPVAEAGGALDLRPGSIVAGWRTFVKP